MTSSRDICESKVRFETRDEAQRFAAKVRHRGMAAQRAYHCKVCSSYHLATKRSPVEITSPAAPAVGRATVVGLVARCLASCEQMMAYEDRDGVPRVVVGLPADEWRELAALVGVGDDECA